jgi:hypothetical protein
VGVSYAASDVANYRPLSRAGEFRQHAHICIEAAVRATDEENCAAFLELASRWIWLAKWNERSEPKALLSEDFQSVRVVVIKPRPVRSE